jgi:hypothetical protein
MSAALQIRAAALSTVIAVAVAAAPAVAPVLGLTADRFTVDGRVRFLVLVSYFDALRASDATLESDFAYLRRHGIDGIRVFATWWRCAAPDQCGGHPGQDTLLTPGTGRPQPEGLARLGAVLAAAGRHRLIVDLSFARETVVDAAGRPLPPQAFADGVAAVVQALGTSAPHVMIDLQNEADQNRVFAADAAGDARAIGRVTRRVATAGRIVFVSTSDGEAPLVLACGERSACPPDARAPAVLAVHDRRMANWHDRTPAVVRALRELTSRRAAPTPIYLQEPQAWQDERAADRVERFLDAAARARRAGAAAWTYHTRSAFVLRDGRSLQGQLSAGERSVIEQLRARVDAAAPR